MAEAYNAYYAPMMENLARMWGGTASPWPAPSGGSREAWPGMPAWPGRRSHKPGHRHSHDCGCDATHAKFRQLHALHAWFRRKGFDFLAIELWASDVPAGRVTEKITFRDRPHFEQFVTLLKIDESWQELAAGNESAEEEYYYLYQ